MQGGLARKIDAGPRLTEAEPQARPKVLRRPAHFSGALPAPAPHAEDDDLPLSAQHKELETPASRTAAPVAIRPWQDDARFGAALLLIVLLVNAALVLWLPRLGHHTPAPAFTASAPAPIPDSPRPDVALYSNTPAPNASLPTVHILDDSTPYSVSIGTADSGDAQ